MDSNRPNLFAPSFLRQTFGDGLICWHGCRHYCTHRKFPAWKIHGYRMLNAEWEGRGAARYLAGAIADAGGSAYTVNGARLARDGIKPVG